MGKFIIKSLKLKNFRWGFKKNKKLFVSIPTLIDKEIEIEPGKLKSKTAMDLYSEIFLEDYVKYFQRKYGEFKLVEVKNVAIQEKEE